MCSQHRIAVVAGLGQRGVGIGAQQHRIGTVDADQPQLAQGLGDGVGVVAHIGRQAS